MIRAWTVQRTPANGNAIIGTFTTDDGLTCVSLERLGVEIAAGRYPVTLTKSPESEKGVLWSPYPVNPGDPPTPLDHVLPEIHDVPGRSGLRIHAFNSPLQSLGCIGTGTDHTATELEHSRPTVTRIVNELATAEKMGDQVFLTILPAVAA